MHWLRSVIIVVSHPKLMIIDDKQGQFFSKVSKLAVQNMNIFSYVNTKIVYLEKHFRKQIVSLYNNVMMDQCNLYNDLLRSQLALQTNKPGDFAYLYMRQPGFISFRSGETVRIAKCLPVEVIYRKSENCYEELTVSRENNSLYMTPVTKILVSKGNKINCNQYIAPMYHLNNVWMEFTPQASKAIPPQTFHQEQISNWTYEAPENLASAGIYSAEDIQQFQENIMFPMEKPAIINTIAREATGG